MQEDWHKIDTANEKRVRSMFFNSYRPKIWLRRCQDEAGRFAIRTYILNDGKEGEAIALKNLRHTLSQ